MCIITYRTTLYPLRAHERRRGMTIKPKTENPEKPMPTQLTDTSLTRPVNANHLVLSFQGPDNLKQCVLILGNKSLPDLCIVKDLTDKGAVSGKTGISAYEFQIGVQQAEKTLINTTKEKTQMFLFPLPPNASMVTTNRPTSPASLNINLNDPDWVQVNVRQAFPRWWEKIVRFLKGANPNNYLHGLNWKWALGIIVVFTLLLLFVGGSVLVWKNWPTIKAIQAKLLEQNPAAPQSNTTPPAPDTSVPPPAIDLPANPPAVVARSVTNSTSATSEISVQPGPTIVVGNNNNGDIDKIKVITKNYYHDGRLVGSDRKIEMIKDAAWAYGLTAQQVHLPDPKQYQYPVRVLIPANVTMRYVLPFGHLMRPTAQIYSPSQIQGAYNLGPTNQPRWAEWLELPEETKHSEYLFKPVNEDVTVVFDLVN